MRSSHIYFIIFTVTHTSVAFLSHNTSLSAQKIKNRASSPFSLPAQEAFRTLSRAVRARGNHTQTSSPLSPRLFWTRREGTKQNLKMAACGHCCASFSSSFKVCNDYLYDFFSDDDSTKTWYLFWEQLPITWPHHLHLSERVKERGLTQ